MIFRKYRITDFEEYHSFCKRNFGGHSYQSTQNYVDWLYDKNFQSFAIALNNSKVVGIEHNFKAPIFVDGNCEFVTVLHDLMVDDVDRGSVGFRLMQDSLKADDYLVLPGSVGRLSRATGDLGRKNSLLSGTGSFNFL